MGGTPLSGVDFAFDAIGIAKTTEQIIQAARGRQIWEREGGTAVLVGVPHGPAAVPDMYISRLAKSFAAPPAGSAGPNGTIRATFSGSRTASSPSTCLVSQRYTLDQINEGIAQSKERPDRRPSDH